MTPERRMKKYEAARQAIEATLSSTTDGEEARAAANAVLWLDDAIKAIKFRMARQAAIAKAKGGAA